MPTSNTAAESRRWASTANQGDDYQNMNGDPAPIRKDRRVGKRFALIFLILGVVQFVIALLSIILGFASMVYVNDNPKLFRKPFAFVVWTTYGAGTWAGACILLSGILAMIAGRRPYFCQVFAALLTAAFGALASAALCGFSIASAVFANRRYEFEEPASSFLPVRSELFVYTPDSTIIGLHATMAIFGIISFITSSIVFILTFVSLFLTNDNTQASSMYEMQQANMAVVQPTATTVLGQQTTVAPVRGRPIYYGQTTQQQPVFYQMTAPAEGTVTAPATGMNTGAAV